MRHEFEVDLKPVWHRLPGCPRPPKRRIPPIRRMLVLAYQIKDHMTAHKVRTLTEFCRRTGITPARGSQIMSLLQLSPRIQEQILLEESARHYDMSEYVIRPILKELIWEFQEETWENSALLKKGRHVVLLHLKRK